MELIDLTKVTAVYAGKNNRCCCGCSGKHTKSDDKNDSAIKRHVNKMNVMIRSGRVLEGDGSVYRAVVSDTDRLYIAYFDER